jgi:hypothetical protein
VHRDFLIALYLCSTKSRFSSCVSQNILHLPPPCFLIPRTCLSCSALSRHLTECLPIFRAPNSFVRMSQPYTALAFPFLYCVGFVVKSMVFMVTPGVPCTVFINLAIYSAFGKSLCTQATVRTFGCQYRSCRCSVLLFHCIQLLNSGLKCNRDRPRTLNELKTAITAFIRNIS